MGLIDGIYSMDVSIHAPWEGCDRVLTRLAITHSRFQFTHPGKGATDDLEDLAIRIRVSIHAPWEGCDLRRRRGLRPNFGFNSRTLGRVRPKTVIYGSSGIEFQFTHPGKGATT